MPRRAQPDDAIDPVRSRLAAAAASPVEIVTTDPQALPVKAEPPRQATTVQQRGGGNGKIAEEQPRRISKPRILTVNRKIMVTPDEADNIEATTSTISAAFGSKVTYSQVSRAVWSVLAGAEDAILAGARRAPRLRVPSKGDHVGMAEYEEALADFLATALKRS